MKRIQSLLKLKIQILIWAYTIALCFSFKSYAWHDETHLAISKAAGYGKWYNSAGADLAKTKAPLIERYNHFFNNDSGLEITPKIVTDQIKFYDDPKHTEGHIYGAIIASIRKFQGAKDNNKYEGYHLAFTTHYIGDLSQPLHNTPYDDFNKKHHLDNDGIVEQKILKNLSKIKNNIYPIVLKKESFEDDLAKEIARIANLSRNLGLKLKAENRNMTQNEAYVQLGHSASLFKAILDHLKTEQSKRL